MSGHPSHHDGSTASPAATDAERRRLLADALSDALPDGTSDERGDTWGEPGAGRGGAGDDDWLRSQVPPHHG